MTRYKVGDIVISKSVESIKNAILLMGGSFKLDYDNDIRATVDGASINIVSDMYSNETIIEKDNSNGRSRPVAGYDYHCRDGFDYCDWMLE
jgi:hypothetical protein